VSEQFSANSMPEKMVKLQISEIRNVNIIMPSSLGSEGFTQLMLMDDFCSVFKGRGKG